MVTGQIDTCIIGLQVYRLVSRPFIGIQFFCTFDRRYIHIVKVSFCSQYSLV